MSNKPARSIHQPSLSAMQNFVKGPSPFEAVAASAPARVPKHYLAPSVAPVPTPPAESVVRPVLAATPEKKKAPRLHAAPSGALRRQVTVYLPADKLKKLQHEAVNLEMSQSDIVEAAIDAYFAARGA